MTKSDVWTRTNCEHLQTWWEQDGYTCGRISDEFAAMGWIINTNQIIGKVFRMKLKPPEWKAKALRDRASEIMKISNIDTGIRHQTPNIKVTVRKKLNAQFHRKEAAVAETPKSNGNTAVLLKHSKEGQCKAIIGYVHGKLENAVYCGKPTPLTPGGGHAPWCPDHHDRYTTEPRGRR